MMRRALTRRLFAPAPGRAACASAWLPALHRSAPADPHPRFRAFHRLLIERGLAVRAGEGFPQPRGQAPDDLSLVVARIKALLA